MTTVTQPQTLQQEIADRFARDTAEHVLAIRHDDGLYRHLYCAKPGTGIWSFEVITWPETLVVRGDFGPARVFRRLTDMFEFFRADGSRINPGYWAEKLDGGGRASAVQYSEDIARQRIAECLDQYETDTYPGLLQRLPSQFVPASATSPSEARQLVADHEANGYLDHADGARELLHELESLGVTADTWEWDLRDWDWTFLWACHAIVWAIHRYDAAQGGEVLSTTPVPPVVINPDPARRMVTVDLPGVTG